MKRQITTILCTGIAAVTAFAGFSTLFDDNARDVAFATSETTTEQKDVLITPDSYQEYLTLDTPYHVAVCGNYTAIADGSTIYVYSVDEGLYQTYQHQANENDITNNVITKLAFAENNTLYFLDRTSSLYYFHPAVLFNGTATDGNKNEWLKKATDFSCINFAINGNELYFLNGSSGSYNIHQTTLSNPKNDAPVVVKASSDSVFFLQGKNLYYTNSDILRASGELTAIWDGLTAVTDSIDSMAILDNVVYYTTERNAFYAYDLAANQAVHAPFEKEDGPRGYSAVTTHAGKVYVIKNHSVCEYDPATQSFTDFEIGASSTSANRLQAGKDSVLFEDKVYTADNGRVSIYDTITKRYTTINDTITADYVATTGDTVLLATATKVVLYSVATGEPLLTLDNPGEFSGSVIGVTQVYGKYYFATNSMQYSQISKGSTGWTCQSEKRLNTTPKFLSSDAQGYLYLTTAGGNVYKLTEEQFLSTDDLANPILTGIDADSTKKILLDYKQNIYALQGNTLLKYSPNADGKYAIAKNEKGEDIVIPLGKELVYGQTTATPVTTITFDAVREDAYIIYNGNLMIATNGLNLPCMENIQIDNAADDIFAPKPAGTITVATLKNNPLLVEFDLESLYGATTFPYTGYTRATEEVTALVLGKTDEYAVLAIYDTRTHQYHTYLTENSDNYLQEKVNSEEAAPITNGWLSSSANLYKFPYLNKLLTVTNLPKNQEVQVLGKITVDYEYYHVSYTVEVVEDGETKTKNIEGYVPASFVNDFSSTPPATQESTLGEGSVDTAATRRTIVILLGFTAVVILVDFLILRPRKKKGD